MRTVFREVMTGTLRLAGEPAPRSMRLDLHAELPGLLHPWMDVTAEVTGRLSVAGWADDVAVAGALEIAPLRARRIRYRLWFTAGAGRRLQLDGWKSIRLDRPVRTMTRLPLTVLDDEGRVMGEGCLRFHLGRQLLPMLTSVRTSPAPPPTAAELLRLRWRGRPGRLEVWYSTITDPRTGTGVWLHHELVAPGNGGDPYAHGWAGVFPPDEAPVLARFGPVPWQAPDGPEVYRADGVTVSVDRLCGRAGDVSWDLNRAGGGDPLYTFPRWAWRHDVLPAAQIVPLPAARFTGTLRYGQSSVELDGAPGNVAHIDGHGNAARWAWLHADLGDGDVCEVVAAVAARPGLSRLPALPMVRLRVGGVDLPPADPLLASARLHADIGLPQWTVRGPFGSARLRIDVTQPADRTLAVDYTGPDGAAAVCHNSERADALILVERRSGGRWRTWRRWTLDGTAHAEVGSRG
jgi:hypothetical protein